MVLVDSGFWLALANGRDSYHRPAVALLQEQSAALVTTWPVLTEVCHLLLHRLGEFAQLRFIDTVGLSNEVQIFDLKRTHLPKVQKLMRRYQKLPMDLADASLVVAAEELCEGRILSRYIGSSRRSLRSAARRRPHHR